MRPVLLRRALAAVALVVGLSGCGSSAATTGVGPSASASSTELQVGDQGLFLQTLLKASGQLDGVASKVNFAQFASGPLVNAAFVSKNIDVGFMGDTPASATVSGSIPVKTIGVAKYSGPVSVLEARPGITTIAALRGKKVAFTTGTAQHALALRALASAGMSQSDVVQVDVPLNQLGTVLVSGQVDAAVLSPADVIKYKADHTDAVTLAGSDTLQPPSYLYFLATQAALADAAKSAAAFDLVRRIARAEAWVSGHQSDWVNAYYVGVNHQKPAVAKQLVSSGGLVSFVELSSDVQHAEQQLVDLLAKAGAISATFDVSPLYDPSATATYNNLLKELR